MLAILVAGYALQILVYPNSLDKNLKMEKMNMTQGYNWEYSGQFMRDGCPVLWVILLVSSVPPCISLPRLL